MYTSEHLDELKWEHPAYYGGHSPDGHYVAAFKNRDSSILEQSNFDVTHKALLAKISEDDNENSRLYTFTANHWACGWVEYLILENNASDQALRELEGIYCALSDYPVLDDSDYSEHCYEAIHEYWEQCSTDDRIDECKRAGISIFSARQECTPELVFDELAQNDQFC